MARPKEINQYIIAHKSEKSAKSLKESLRPTVLEYLKNFGDDEDISLGSQTRTSIKEEELLLWLKHTQPREVIDRLTKTIVDLAKFEEFITNEEVKVDDIPSTCYTISTIPVINILKKRKENE